MTNIPIQVGAEYAVDSQRKGKFMILVTKADETWITGKIISGKATALCDYNERELGEEVTLRDSLTHFTLI